MKSFFDHIREDIPKAVFLTALIWFFLGGLALASNKTCPEALSEPALKFISPAYERSILESTNAHREIILKRIQWVESAKDQISKARRFIGNGTQKKNGLAHPFLFTINGLSQKAHLLSHPQYHEPLHGSSDSILSYFRDILAEFRNFGYDINKEIHELTWRVAAFETFKAALSSNTVKDTLAKNNFVTIDIPVGRHKNKLRYKTRTFESRQQIKKAMRHFLTTNSTYFHRSPLDFGERRFSYRFLKERFQRQAVLFRYLEILVMELEQANLDSNKNIGRMREKLLVDVKKALENLILRPPLLSLVSVSRKSIHKELEFYVDMEQEIPEDVKNLTARIAPEYRSLFALRIKRSTWGRFKAKTARIYLPRALLYMPIVFSTWVYSPTLNQAEYFFDQYALNDSRIKKIVALPSWPDRINSEQAYNKAIMTYMYQKHGVTIRFEDGQWLTTSLSDNPYAQSDMLKFKALRFKELEKQNAFMISFAELQTRTNKIYQFYSKMSEISFSSNIEIYSSEAIKFVEKYFSISMNLSEQKAFAELITDFHGEIDLNSKLVDELSSKDKRLIDIAFAFSSMASEAQILLAKNISAMEIQQAKTQMIITAAREKYRTIESIFNWTLGFNSRDNE